MNWLSAFFDENSPAEPPMDSQQRFQETTEALPEAEAVQEFAGDTADVQATSDAMEPEAIPEASVDDLPPPDVSEQQAPAELEVAEFPADDLPPPPDFETVDFGTAPAEETVDAGLLEQAEDWVNEDWYDPSAAEKQEMAQDAQRNVEDMIADAIQDHVDPLRFT